MAQDLDFLPEGVRRIAEESISVREALARGRAAYDVAVASPQSDVPLASLKRRQEGSWRKA